jgi:hypothetical protein
MGFVALLGMVVPGVAGAHKGATTQFVSSPTRAEHAKARAMIVALATNTAAYKKAVKAGAKPNVRVYQSGENFSAVIAHLNAPGLVAKDFNLYKKGNAYSIKPAYKGDRWERWDARFSDGSGYYNHIPGYRNSKPPAFGM